MSDSQLLAVQKLGAAIQILAWRAQSVIGTNDMRVIDELCQEAFAAIGGSDPATSTKPVVS